MKRLISTQLASWKTSKSRKPLILKGVRQTGKTYQLKEFGKQAFAKCHYINFEKNERAHEIFDNDLNPIAILDNLSFLLQQPINIQQDLLIFDEIQACPRALTSLKYFSEDMSELALVSAGSLLGLHLNEASFPVGKVDFLVMKPMSFVEFLLADDDQRSIDMIDQAISSLSLSSIVHTHLWDKFKIYLVTGGLPEVVKTYIENKNDLFTALALVRKKQEELIYGYYSDIAKHSGKVNAMHIDRVWRAIPSQLAQSQNGSAKRFQFKGIIPGIDRFQRLANVIDWLLAAELITKVNIVEHVEQPLSAFTEDSFFKLYLFDVGILGALANLEPAVILAYNYGTYKGYFAENFIAQEFLAKDVKHLYSWQDNRAEIEFLYAYENKIIPIEVKSGFVTKNQSLNKYTEKYNPPYRVVFSAKNLNIDLKNDYYQLPLYMAHWFPFVR
jgi:predicted AAA+ superfamily ATPase